MPYHAHALPEFIWRNYANIMCVFALLLMVALLAPIPLFADVPPSLIACVVGYGVMQRVSISSALLTVLGLVCDIISGLPLGVTALQLLGLKWGLDRYMDAIEDTGFMTRYVWVTLGFSGCFVLHYGVASFLMHRFLPLLDLLLPWVVTTLCYPLIHWLLVTLQRRLYRRVWVFLPSEYKPIP